MAKDLVSPIPAPASPGELAEFLDALDGAASWVQPTVAGAVPFLDTVVAAGADVGEVLLVDADPPVALLGVAAIVFIFGAGLLIHAIGYLFAQLPWPLSTAGQAIENFGQQLIQYGIDIVEWMVRPLIQLGLALWHGLDKLLGLGLATAAQLAIAVYKHIHIIGPHQIAANDTGIAAAAAAAINTIIATAPDYQMKAALAGDLGAEALMKAIPRLVPSTAAGAITALALNAAANTEVIAECALPWCDTVDTGDDNTLSLGNLLGGLLGAALFCRLVSDPAGTAAVITRDSGLFLDGLGVAMILNGDPAGALYSELLNVVINDPAGAASFITSKVC
jgi:hypothetical protein